MGTTPLRPYPGYLPYFVRERVGVLRTGGPVSVVEALWLRSSGMVQARLTRPPLLHTMVGISQTTRPFISAILGNDKDPSGSIGAVGRVPLGPQTRVVGRHDRNG